MEYLNLFSVLNAWPSPWQTIVIGISLLLLCVPRYNEEHCLLLCTQIILYLSIIKAYAGTTGRERRKITMCRVKHYSYRESTDKKRSYVYNEVLCTSAPLWSNNWLHLNISHLPFSYFANYQNVSPKERVLHCGIQPTN